jgi:hypothetical protein
VKPTRKATGYPDPGVLPKLRSSFDFIKFATIGVSLPLIDMISPEVWREVEVISQISDFVAADAGGRSLAKCVAFDVAQNRGTRALRY